MTDASGVVYGSRTLDPEIVLGTLAWYEVRGVCVPHKDALDVHKKLGLTRPLPGSPSDQNTFAKVCSRGGDKDVPTTDPKVTANYLIRPVSPQAAAACQGVGQPGRREVGLHTAG